jgi:hypothetical protein
MITDLESFYEEHEDEFLKFNRVTHKLSNRPDLHAFLLLDKLVPGNSDIVSDAGYDEIYLDTSPDSLLAVATEDELIELHRCGVLYSGEYDSLYMFT